MTNIDLCVDVDLLNALSSHLFNTLNVDHFVQGLIDNEKNN